jgi:hypothetical protein
MSTEKTLSDEVRMLAAMAYGEASTADDEKEIYSLASVLCRQKKDRGYTTIKEFGTKDKSFSFVTSDGNERYSKLMKATVSMIEKDAGMSIAIKAAESAIGRRDYSNSAYFWDR